MTRSTSQPLIDVYVRLQFTAAAAKAIVEDEKWDDLEELRHYKDKEVDDICKLLRRTKADGGGGTAVGTQSVHNLKLMIYWLNHRHRTSQPVQPEDVTLAVIRLVRPIREAEEAHVNLTSMPSINEKDWPKTMELVQEYLRGQMGKDGIPLAYIIRAPPGENRVGVYPIGGYPTVEDELIARAPHGVAKHGDPPEWIADPTFIANDAKVWEILANICRDHSCYTYLKPAQKKRSGRDAYFALYNHFLGPNNVSNMAAMAEDILQNTTYTGEQRRWNFERYVNLHKQQHSILNGLKDHGHAGLDGGSMVRHLMHGIKTDKFDSIKSVIMADPEYRKSFDKCVTLYQDFIRHSEKGKSAQHAITIAEVNTDG